jgi:hypothetical protein
MIPNPVYTTDGSRLVSLESKPYGLASAFGRHAFVRTGTQIPIVNSNFKRADQPAESFPSFQICCLPSHA